MASALRLGTKDASLFFHAGLIYEKIGETAEARAFLDRAVALNPQFNLLLADVAQQALRRLSGDSSATQKGGLADAQP
jgi:Flp pilus assembly protein TadD